MLKNFSPVIRAVICSGNRQTIFGYRPVGMVCVILAKQHYMICAEKRHLQKTKDPRTIKFRGLSLFNLTHIMIQTLSLNVLSLIDLHFHNRLHHKNPNNFQPMFYVRDLYHKFQLHIFQTHILHP